MRFGAYELRPLKSVWSAWLMESKGLPARPPEKGFAAMLDGRVSAGVVIYDTAGPFVIFEHLFTHHGSMRERHRAVQLVVLQSLSYCTAVGKQALMLNRIKGVRMMLQRTGIGNKGELELLVSHLEEST